MKNLLVVIVLMLVIYSCGDARKKPIERKEVKKETEKTAIDSPEDARKNAVGTWQFITGEVWYKYVIKNDGSFDYFMAEPKNGRWTQNPGGTWDTGNDRYNDTGNKFYYFAVTHKSKTGYKNERDEYHTYKFAYKNSKMVYSPNYEAVGNPLGIKTDESPWKD